tara:strand:- start:78 stop:317 length:240 start_codon:yes stop_codon:yes gene_type:complete
MNTNFDANTQAIFLNHWREAIRTAKRLQLSLRRLKASFPLAGESLLNPSDDLLDGVVPHPLNRLTISGCGTQRLSRTLL